MLIQASDAHDNCRARLAAVSHAASRGGGDGVGAGACGRVGSSVVLTRSPAQKHAITAWPRLGSASEHDLLRLASAYDRSGGVLMDAVRVTDLDVDEPGVGERALEFGAREGAGDAARPGRHVGARRHRASGAHLFAEAIATLGLLLVIFSLARSGRASTAPAAVGAYIGAAYWFTSSTSFANPAISVGRIFSDTFAGIAPASVPAFTLAQVAGGVIAIAALRVLYPDVTPRDATDVIVPHTDTTATTASQPARATP
jgi:hypothetical protein